MSLIQRTAKIRAKWFAMRYESRLDRLSEELENMRQLRDFAAREAERLQRELIVTWREAEEACRE